MVITLILSNIVMIFVFLIKLDHLPPQIPLFYSRPWGEEQLADWWMILYLILVLNTLFFLNNYIEKKFFADNQLIAKIFTYLNFFLIITVTFIFIKIIFLIS